MRFWFSNSKFGDFWVFFLLGLFELMNVLMKMKNKRGKKIEKKRNNSLMIVHH
jgi:hypothetical protein